MAISNYRELIVWQKAMDLVTSVYELSEEFPPSERFGLTSQIPRAAVSIPTNIAEGYARTHRGDYLHHLSFAKGSLAEVETLLTLAVRLKRIDRQQTLPVWGQSQDVGRLLTRLIASLRRSGPKP